MKKGTNQKVIDQLEKAFDLLIPNVPEGIQTTIVKAFRDDYIDDCTDTYCSESGEFYRTMGTYSISRRTGIKCSVLRYHLRKMEKSGIIQFMKNRSYENNLVWSIKSLEGFQYKHQAKGSDMFELIKP